MSIQNDKLMNLADGKVLYDDLRGRVETAVSTLNGAINAKADEPTGTKSAGKVYGLDSSLNPVWVEQSGGGGQADIGLSIVDGKLCVTYEEASA